MGFFQQAWHRASRHLFPKPVARVQTARPFVHDQVFSLFFSDYCDERRVWQVRRATTRRGLAQLRMSREVFLETETITYAPLPFLCDGTLRALVVHHLTGDGTMVRCFLYDVDLNSGRFVAGYPLDLPIPAGYSGHAAAVPIRDRDGGWSIYYHATDGAHGFPTRYITRARTRDWKTFEPTCENIGIEVQSAGPSFFTWDGETYLACCWNADWKTPHKHIGLWKYIDGVWTASHVKYLEFFGHPFFFTWHGKTYFLADDNNRNIDRCYFFLFEGPDKLPRPLGYFNGTQLVRDTVNRPGAS